MHLLLDKFKDILMAVLPITLIVVILHFTLVPLGSLYFSRFLLGAFFVVIGLSIFLLGVDLSISRIGALIGQQLAKSNKIIIVLIVGLVLGFFISIAEPDLHILANQIQEITSGSILKNSILITVSLGIAVLLALGLFRILYQMKLKNFLLITYSLIFVLALFSSQEFLAMAFDASGATTGAMAVPFVMAMSLGVASLNKNTSSAEEDSFGLVGIISTGAIIGVLLLGLISKNGTLSGSLPVADVGNGSLLDPFLNYLPIVSWEIFLALAPLLIIFALGNHFFFKVTKRRRRQIYLGSLYTFIGLVIFLVGVNAGFMEAGRLVGSSLQSLGKPWLTVLVGFILGLVVILAEPAVYVLTNQVEEVTSGHLSRKVVLTTLSIGVAFAVSLSIVRILVPALSLWHFLLPGYLISMILTRYVPSLFIGIAFDSGGVASGPMTATFIFAFAQGVSSQAASANVLIDGFGIIAMVAMAPLISLQILGVIYKLKSKKGGL
ncbi:MAG: DUF1538 domain-containing protein [Clostridium sp.]|nr:DUF1538 domain-containing protein [Clostridium sp.]